MNILVVSQYFWPENFRINELVSELAQRGHHVTVLTGVPNYPEGEIFPAYQLAPQQFAHYQGVDVVRVPMRPRGQGKVGLVLNYLSFVLSACCLGAWNLRSRPFDVIFTFEPSPITVGIPSAWLRFLKRAPQAFWVLDLWPETLKAVNVIRSEKILRKVEVLVRFVYRHCDLILAQSKSFVTDIRRLTSPQQRIEYFPAWADTVFEQTPAAPAPEVALRPEQFTVMFAGNIGEAQDFPAILNAAEALQQRRDIRWVIVGDGRKADWVREQITLRSLEHTVVMAGRHPLERMPEFFAHADALLVSLKDEPIFAMTIPGKLQSYFAAGLPVLAMLNGEGAQIVATHQAGLVCAAGDGQGLAKHVAQLADMDAAARMQMGRNGLALARHQFDKTTLVTQLETWLVELAQRRTAQRGTQA